MTIGTMNNVSVQEDLIQLKPLVHQVGGHSTMFVLDNATVCKPLIGREYQFYRSLPSEMVPFVPEFRGCLKVVVQEDGNTFSIAALPNEQTISLCGTKRTFQNGSKLRRVSSSSLDYESSSDEDSASGYGLPITESKPKNPWLQQCQQNSLHKLTQKSDSSNVVECIMLENLTHKYRYPCVLDLKMGIRQYGDDATESKRRSQTAKALNTTTVSLGVRLAGMQVYNKEKKCYICKNKYYGRQLCEDNLKQALKQFLHNGKHLQFDVMDGIVEKLRDLRSIVAKLDSFRFFTSSLLILYDNWDTTVKSGNQDADRVMDSRVSSRARSTGATEDNVNQENYAPSSRRRNKEVAGVSMTVGEQLEEDYKLKRGAYRKNVQRSKVDIRLIDFAHATHEDMKDQTVYKDSDEGLLLGLDSLIKIFQGIKTS